MDKNQALAICEKYLPVWLRFKKDSTTKDNGMQMWNELNTVHRFAFQQFADLGCNDCIIGMFRSVFTWYERESAKAVEPTKSVPMSFPATEVDLTTKTYPELITMARDKNIATKRNISKSELIELIRNHK